MKDSAATRKRPRQELCMFCPEMLEARALMLIGIQKGRNYCQFCGKWVSSYREALGGIYDQLPVGVGEFGGRFV